MIDLSNETMVHVKKDEVEFLQFRKLLEYPELVHCYTLKANDFDIAGNETYEEKKNKVEDNYTKLASSLQIPKETIIRPYQTHTNIVKRIDEKKNEIEIFPKEFTNVDGLITNQTGITCSLSFADCTPIYLYDPVKKVIGDVHSGWKGTLTRIGKVAVESMVQEYGCNPKDIICCIGPCIRKCHFEVSKDVADNFQNEFQEMEDMDEIITFLQGKNKYVIDTCKINENMMKEVGLKKENIIDSGICTVCNNGQMHSYRAHKELAGRNTAILGMRK